MAHQTPDGDAVAMDGKTMRGSCDRDPGTDGEPLDEPPQQQLTAVGIGSRRVLAHVGFSGKKDEAEGATLRDLLEKVRKPGRCVVADALHTQRATAARIVELGMRYALCVKGNQPTLLAQVRDDRTWSDPCTVEVTGDHGRIETRTIQVSEDFSEEFPDCPEWLDFPDARRVFRIRREVEYKKTGRKREVETACFVTNLRGKAARARNACRTSCAATGGRSRTASTTCATRPWARTAAGCARGRCRASWRPSRTSRSRSCACWGRRTSGARCGTSATARTGRRGRSGPEARAAAPRAPAPRGAAGNPRLQGRSGASGRRTQ